jgi:outer membrane protein assembly factor BamD (BamD/ComL family)
MKHILGTVLTITVLLCALSACQTTPEDIEEGLPPAELFQRAQEAVIERNDYKTALIYYQAFLQRYPDDLQNRVKAEYEIAFLHYKMGEEKRALRGFQDLLDYYEGEQAEVLPQWPRVLAEKLIKIIQEEQRSTQPNEEE